MERNTVLVFMTDNGGTGGVRVFNAGMRGQKATAYQGGTRVPLFVRWTGTYEPGDIRALSGAIDLFPTFAELAGTQIPANLELDGRSLAPLLRNHNAAWADRHLFTHLGRWPKGKASESKYAQCRVRTARWSMVSPGPAKKWELYDLPADPGEKNDIAGANAAVVRQLDAAYDQWWASILPCLENEDAVPPAVAPYKELYWKQFGKPAA
jgi:arylsulfatase